MFKHPSIYLIMAPKCKLYPRNRVLANLISQRKAVKYVSGKMKVLDLMRKYIIVRRGC